MAWGTGLAATKHRGYWPGYCRPQNGLGYWPGCYSSEGVLDWLLQPPGWPRGTGLAATAPSLSWGYWPGCYRLQNGLGILAWLLHSPGWPVGTGLAATAHRGYWPGCYSPMMASGYRPGYCSPQGVLAWLLQGPGWPGVQAWLLQPTGGTGLAATAWALKQPGQYPLWAVAARPVPPGHSRACSSQANTPGPTWGL